MVNIGSRDIDSYIRTLISQGFDHQPKEEPKSFEQSEKENLDVPSSNRVQPTGIREEAKRKVL